MNARRIRIMAKGREIPATAKSFDGSGTFSDGEFSLESNFCANELICEVSSSNSRCKSAGCWALSTCDAAAIPEAAAAAPVEGIPEETAASGALEADSWLEPSII